ncbi:hypothetical protein GCM10012284_57120 [Mangrovihabitans endophyticus]|uniref:Uncharacterized protein n=1 Tax=Mangrovihabitans endophyticus TaxID=1751298 RepID=A0A8J3C4S8_9ACTN|nr:hypothetical protein GCM10012284_57120 [Mangrovihabitans endophyticus]
MAARCSSADRVTASDRATAVGSAPARSTSSSRVAFARSAAGLRPDTSQGSSSGCTAAGSASADGAGASSMMACALVPLSPNEETPARRGSSARGHDRSSVSRRTVPALQSTCVDGVSTCNVRGNVSCRIAITILMIPATPAAAWVWLMFDFTEPSSSGRCGSRPRPYVAISACASTGSPSVVPVPCASTTSTWSADSRAFTSAASITRCCDGPFGAVRPLDAPSEFTAEPRSTARMVRPLRCASDSRSSTSTPTPSDQPVPSAESANERQCPSVARPPCRAISTKVVGLDITVTPAAIAVPHSPCRSDCAARCRATSDDEHAVSTVTVGPTVPKKYARRPDSTLVALPVSTKPCTSSSGPTR